MSVADADAFGWNVAGSLLQLVFLVAVGLLGFALLRELTR
jgi:hypothetical protein